MEKVKNKQKFRISGDIMVDDLNDALFMQLVMSLQTSAWAMLGKVANPLTGKIEKNLDAAKATIDTLAMLKEKTKNNLPKTEQDYLDNVVHQLQLNYMEEAKSKDDKEDTSQNREPISKKEAPEN